MGRRERSGRSGRRRGSQNAGTPAAGSPLGCATGASVDPTRTKATRPASAGAPSAGVPSAHAPSEQSRAAIAFFLAWPSSVLPANCIRPRSELTVRTAYSRNRRKRRGNPCGWPKGRPQWAPTALRHSTNHLASTACTAGHADRHFLGRIARNQPAAQSRGGRFPIPLMRPMGWPGLIAAAAVRRTGVAPGRWVVPRPAARTERWHAGDRR
jgi:hypothetical protein